MAASNSPNRSTDVTTDTQGDPGSALVKLRLAKTDCRIMLTSVARARGELTQVVADMGEGWEGWEAAGDWAAYLESVERELARIVQWARGREDRILEVGKAGKGAGKDG